MRGRERDDAVVFAIDRAGQLDQLDQRLGDRRIDAETAADDQRKLRIEQRIGSGRERVRIGGDRRRRLEVFRVRHRHRTFDLLLLDAAIERHVNRPARLRQRHLVRLGDGVEMPLRRGRLFRPLHVVLDDVGLGRGAVQPVDPAPIGGIERARAAQHQHRRVIAERVVDAHRPVHQADQIVQDADADPAGGLGVAVRHRHRDLLVRGEHHLRLVVTAVVDQRVMQAAIARARQQEDVVDVEPSEQLDHGVGPEFRVALVGGQIDRRLAQETLRGVFVHRLLPAIACSFTEAAQTPPLVSFFILSGNYSARGRQSIVRSALTSAPHHSLFPGTNC